MKAKKSSKVKTAKLKTPKVDKQQVVDFLVEIQEVCRVHDMWFGGCGCCGSPFITSKSVVPAVDNVDMDEEKIDFVLKGKKYTFDGCTLSVEKQEKIKKDKYDF